MRFETVLCRITKLIVRACDPEAILLFGSYAKGTDNQNSDLDFLVISDLQGSPYLRGQEIHDLLRRYPIPIDLHFVTPEEVACASQYPFGFLSSVLTSSKKLYQKGIDKLDF